MKHVKKIQESNKNIFIQYYSQRSLGHCWLWWWSVLNCSSKPVSLQFFASVYSSSAAERKLKMLHETRRQKQDLTRRNQTHGVKSCHVTHEVCCSSQAHRWALLFTLVYRSVDDVVLPLASCVCISSSICFICSICCAHTLQHIMTNKQTDSTMTIA